MPEILCDLVLLSWNHLEETQPCLETLFATTTVPSRLFIVDNGSEPHVRSYLAALKPSGAIREVTLLQNNKNEGFPRGMNRGILASSAPYVCLLNNDLRFTPGWLEELIFVARLDPKIGVINPGSSTFGNHPPAGSELDEHAQRMSARHGEYVEVGMCIGFCMLITREVLDKLGGLNEEVQRIFFEDEDFCMRAAAAGYRCVVAEGAYVFHAEHKTVKKMPEREALFTTNRKWCEQKWGRRLRIAWPRFTPPAPGSEELRQWLTCLVSWARRRNLIYVYSPSTDNLTGVQLFRSVGLVPHADVQWHPIPEAVAPVAAAGLILKRRKKPFDVIASPDQEWGSLMRRLGWLHGANIVAQDNEDQLVEAWQTKSRSPLSS